MSDALVVGLRRSDLAEALVADGRIAGAVATPPRAAPRPRRYGARLLPGGPANWRMRRPAGAAGT